FAPILNQGSSDPQPGGSQPGGGQRGGGPVQAAQDKAAAVISGFENLRDKVDPCHNSKTGFSNPWCLPSRQSNLRDDFSFACGLQGMLAECRAAGDKIANDPAQDSLSTVP